MSHPPSEPSSPVPADGKVFRVCPLCEACCGLELTLESGRVTSVRGDAFDPFSRGYVCPKAVALMDLHDDPDRIRTPMLRRNGRLQPAGWDEAFDAIEHALAPLIREHGRDATGLALGNPVAHKMGLGLYVRPLARALGTRNIFTASTLDQMPRQLACALMYGDPFSVPVPDIDRTDLLLVLGANPAVSNGSLWTVPGVRSRLKALRARGGRLIVIDPRRTETADLADQHLFIAPGTDVYLLLALVHTLFDESRVAPGPVAQHLAGLAELQQAVAGSSAERLARHCGLTPEVVRGLARELACAKHAAVYGRLGTCTQRFGTLNSWLIDALNILTGRLDQPGGVMFPKAAAFASNTCGVAGRGKGFRSGRWHSRVSGAPEVAGELPMGCLAEEIETPGAGRVRALFTVATNPVLSAPNGRRLATALQSLDLMVSVDLYLNETTRHAHVVLPGSSPFEESHYDAFLSQFSCRNQARYSSPALPMSTARPAEWEVLLRLTAIAEGRGSDADCSSIDDELAESLASRLAGTGAARSSNSRIAVGLRGPERLLQIGLRLGPYGDCRDRASADPPEGGPLNLERLLDAPHGLDLGALRPRMPEVLRTASGRIELAPAPLLQDLARVSQALDGLEAATLDGTPKQDPGLRLIGRRDTRSNNSWMHNLPTLSKGPERCVAQIHPLDAARAGLTEGACAELIGARGEAIRVLVELTERMMPGVVSMPHGWGHDLPGAVQSIARRRPGANFNDLADEEARDPLSGTAVLNGIPVRIRVAA